MEVNRSQLSRFTSDQAKEIAELFRAIPVVVNDNGTVQFSPALPTSEPATVGALYTNSGVITISNGL